MTRKPSLKQSKTQDANLKKLFEERVAKFEKRIPDIRKRVGGTEKIKDGRNGKRVIRCQFKKDGKQCINTASFAGLFCAKHHREVFKKDIEKSHSLQKKLQKSGIYRGKVCKKEDFLKKELEEVLSSPIEDLTDVKKDIALSEAIVKKMLTESFFSVSIGDEVKIGKREFIIKTKEDIDVAIELQKKELAEDLQKVIVNNANLKKMYFDIKLSDANTVSKELFLFVFNKIIKILKEEVSDLTVLEKIKKRINSLGLDIKEKGLIK